MLLVLLLPEHSLHRKIHTFQFHLLALLPYQETTNGGTMPALSTDYLLIAKVVTGASAITSVVDYRRMSFSGGLRTRKAQFIMLGDNAPFVVLLVESWVNMVLLLNSQGSSD